MMLSEVLIVTTNGLSASRVISQAREGLAYSSNWQKKREEIVAALSASHDFQAEPVAKASSELVDG